jgi:hypothetical protein
MAAHHWGRCHVGARGCGDNGSDQVITLDGSADANQIDILACSAQTNAAGERLHRFVVDFGQDLACDTQEDCEYVLLTSECFHATCTLKIARRNADAAQAAIAEANAIDCRGFVAAGCVTTPPPCGPLHFRPLCQKGRCVDLNID